MQYCRALQWEGGGLELQREGWGRGAAVSNFCFAVWPLLLNPLTPSLLAVCSGRACL